MDLQALICPQCGAALPRMARWCKVACRFCSALVGRGAEPVARARFREAWLRNQPQEGLPLAGARWRLLHPLGGGAHAEVWLAERLGLVRERVTLKLAWPGADEALRREASTLRSLHLLDGATAAFHLQRVPRVRFEGLHEGRSVLALRHPIGFWGSLQDAAGLTALRDPRHLVWLWGRVLDQLGFLHAQGFTHGDLRAAHWLIHPGDHGVQLCGWSCARRGGDAARDLQQSAATLRETFQRASVPATLQALLDAPGSQAAALRERLRNAAREAFGPPQFVPFLVRT
jgi:hypothetical protein